MSRIKNCRRTFIAVLAILCLTLLGAYNNSVEVAGSIAAIAMALAASNAYQGKKEDK